MKGHNQADVKTVTNKGACDREKSNFEQSNDKKKTNYLTIRSQDRRAQCCQY